MFMFYFKINRESGIIHIFLLEDSHEDLQSLCSSLDWSDPKLERVLANIKIFNDTELRRYCANTHKEETIEYRGVDGIIRAYPVNYCAKCIAQFYTFED